MTLQQWSRKWWTEINTNLAGATWVYAPVGSDGRPDLFHLTDVAVSTVSGPVCYLWPRSSKGLDA